MTGEQKHNISRLLQRLNTADAGSAWAVFIDRYSPLIMKTLGQFEYRQDRSNECFLHVCEKLCERQFRRLQKFNTEGTAQFHNWLSTVVFNLCVDWHRSEFGRATMLPAISALPAFDQLIYRCCYEQDMSRATCFQSIKSDFPELTSEQVSASLCRIHSLLTPRQRWQINARKRHRIDSGEEASSLTAEQIRDPGLEPDSLAQAEEEVAALQTALLQLSAYQRLLLHLRFQEGLAFSRIARLENLGDPHRARRHVHRALDALYVQLQKNQPGRKRQN